MKKLMLSLAALAMVCFSGSLTAEAQVYQSGYEFGTGLQFGGQFGGFHGGLPFGNTFSRPREGLPYFAQFPPVYYSHIVRRPYGISPFAAPPGIVPVEMTIPAVMAEPIIIKNPHFSAPLQVPPSVVSPQQPATEPSELLPEMDETGDASIDSSAEANSEASDGNTKSKSDPSVGESDNKSTQRALPLRIKNPFAVERLTQIGIK